MSRPGSPRLLDSFTAPKDVLEEFAAIADEEDVDPFKETAKKREIASRRGDYANRHLEIDRSGVSIDPFAQTEGDDQSGGYQDAMRRQRLEREEQRVYRAIATRETQTREEGNGEMDLDKTPPREDLEEVEKLITAAKEPAATTAGTKRKRRWDVVGEDEKPANGECQRNQ
jgi:splicing factor 3B subunit 1